MKVLIDIEKETLDKIEDAGKKIKRNRKNMIEFIIKDFSTRISIKGKEI